ncbi:RNA polymerase sigma-70 factor [Catalinimonas niigatensis]|uniref:RNA polymerase sigma-70 factor n=1 Tax=Catalinimonas niigatensis TaxID=1397264 RepID=UPI002665016D|nr:RNA polymerase sigma-70 factor [Catalinimonas niigatensis]WPP51802.1 RNA polymerase sigma-70 factor [Catalinimonas niigatensis]
MKDTKIRHWIQAMAAGDSQAFKLLFDEYYPRLYHLAFYYLRSDVISEEVVSDVFLKLWNNRKRLVEIEHLDFYFFQAVKNQSLTCLKKEARLPQTDELSSKSLRIEYNEPENLLIARELAAMIEEGISQLPEKCEMIFRMVREDGMSYREVAELLEIAPKTVENQMGIALKKLKTALDQYQQTKAKSSFTPLYYLFILLEWDKSIDIFLL